MSGRDRIRPALLLFWLLPAAVATLGLRLVPSRLNPDLTLGEILLSQLLIWLPWGAWTLLIAAVEERVPFERGNAWRAVGVHLLLSPLVVMAQILVIWHIAVEFGMNEPRGLESRLFIGLRQYGDLLMVVYWAVVGTLAGLRWRDRLQEELVQAARLREDLAQANLQALRAQLNPHFLFNAMNAVVTLIGRDPALARDTVVRLADMLRATLAAGDAQETTLEQELALTARYLEIEQLRFADRLTVDWQVEPGLERCRVPAFALQPLVENALKHGLARRRAAGVVQVTARRAGTWLELIVRNDGADDDSAPMTARESGAGIALANLRARLERLYGNAASLELHPRAEGGMDAIVRLPISPTTP